MSEPLDTDARDAQARDATEFWIGRGGLTKNVAAVNPTAANTRLEAWQRRKLQDWTVRRAQRLLGPRCKRAVDLGCGYGEWTERFAAMADEVIACDVSPGFVDEARRRLAATGHVAARVEVADVRAFTDFADADLVYLGAVMTYLEDRDCLALMRQVRARMRPEGALLSRDWCAVGLGRTTTNVKPWFSVHRRASRYVELMAEAGFAVVETASTTAVFSEQVTHTMVGGSEPGTRWLRWVVRAPWTLATAPFTRRSVCFVARPS